MASTATDGVSGHPTDAQQAFSEKLGKDEEPKTRDDHDSQATLKGNEQQEKKAAQDDEKNGGHNAPSGTEKTEEGKKDKKDKKDDKPAGGYDGVPVPKRARGYTVRFTFHRATNLPIADLNSLASDPYITATLTSDTPNRHKEDPPLTIRTPTIQKNCDPEWNEQWIVANIPSSGFKLKLRLYDEDPSDKDDRLGNVHIEIPHVDENFQNIKEKAYKIQKHAGSKRAYLIRAITTCFGQTNHMHGDIYVSIEVLGRTAEDGQDGRLYTVGPCWYTKHYSPLLGRLANTSEPAKQQAASSDDKKQSSQTKRYDFQANQVQLTGPVPKELYHRFVEFKPFVQAMFTGSGIKGFFLSKALHHQHTRVYHFDRSTKWGHLPENPGNEMTKLFLDLVHYDEGARIFTYVLTLDALWRFTETGKEFGIDMLSKHTMHSDVGVYIAFSGEFFIRRLKHPKQPPPPEATEEASTSHPPPHESNPTHPPDDIGEGPPEDDPPKDPKYYELVIDNDSGTYRPNADMLPLLKKFLSQNLPGLHILTLDCQKDEEKMNKMKNEQRERKKKEGEGIVYLQGDNDSISSSDEEDLDAMAAATGNSSQRKERGTLKQAARDAKLKNQGKFDKLKREVGGGHRAEADNAEGSSNTAEAQATSGASA